jgi:hypothetical protein
MSASSLYCVTCGAANPPLVAAPAALAGAVPGSGSLTGLLAPNTLLKQRYCLLAQIGKGGFGAVYRAEDTALGNRKVAVKEMSQRGLTPEELQEATLAFHNEALLLAQLAHPHLPRSTSSSARAGAGIDLARWMYEARREL